MNKQTATTSRPQVARALQAAGYEIKAIPSVWKPGRIEWEFDLDDKSAHIVKRFYEGIDRPAPRMVREFLAQEEQ